MKPEDLAVKQWEELEKWLRAVYIVGYKAGREISGIDYDETIKAVIEWLEQKRHEITVNGSVKNFPKIRPKLTFIDELLEQLKQ